MVTVHSREISFRDQIRLRLEPMLYFVTWLGTFVFVAEVCLSAHFVGGGRKTFFILVYARGRSWPGINDRNLSWGCFVVFHDEMVLIVRM